MQHNVVLVIDDESPVREAVADILDFEKINVLSAANGFEGLKIYQERHNEIQLVLLDLSMPGMSGEETFRELRQFDAEVKVILSSGYTEAEVIDQFEQLGVVDFLKKPYDLAHLVAVINRHLPENR